MIITFTGTRQGMTVKQMNQVKNLLIQHQPSKVLHGDCYGADTEFHGIVVNHRAFLGIRRSEPVIEIHPSNLNSRANNDGDSILPPDDPIRRDRRMVDLCDRVIGTPKSINEELRSGTWTTIRYAKRIGKIVYVIQPDGTIV